MSWKEKSVVSLLIAFLLVGSPAYAQVINPIYTQDFESTPEFSLPTGWTEENWTDANEGSYVAGETTNLGKSMELMGWTVLNSDQLGKLGSNRLSVPAVVSGKSVYAESDTRGGVQLQYLYTPVFDLRNQQNIVMRFDCNYTQNQDNIVFAEYTLQGNLNNDDFNNKIWLPIFYWADVPEVEAAAGNVETLMTTNFINDGGDPYSTWVGADLSTIDFAKQVGGKKNDDQASSKGRLDFELPKAAGQQYVQIRFFQGGGGSWYFGIDNFVIGSLSEAQVQKPDKPSFSIAPASPGIVDDVTLKGSAYNSPSNLKLAKSEWQLGTDSNFSGFAITMEAANDTTLVVPNKNIPLGMTFYVRVRYMDEANQYSDYSDVSTFTLSPPAGVRRLFLEDFESVEETLLPDGWIDMNFSDPGGPSYTMWGVVTAETLTAYGGNRVGVPVFDGKSAYSESDRWGSFQDDHLFSKRYNLTGVKNIWVLFWSNYMQNQDNIGVLEYSVDGGDLNDFREPVGTWLPLMYYLDTADITYNADGTPDAAQTFRDENIADGTQYPYNYWVFAKPLDSLGPYIANGYNDDDKANKLYLKFSLPAAENKSNVVLRWVNMGTGSWFWGIDNVAIWGNDGTDVSEWALY